MQTLSLDKVLSAPADKFFFPEFVIAIAAGGSRTGAALKFSWLRFWNILDSLF